MNLEEAPEEPHLHSEPSLLSPASPKPIHFPTPTNIPVLNNMMDVNFNQTELHMQDPSMRNTAVREGAWKEADAQQEETGNTSVEGEHALAAGEPTNGVQEQPVAANVPMTHDSHESSLATNAARLNVQDETTQPIDQAATISKTATTSSDVANNDNPLHASTSLSIASGSTRPDSQAQATSFSLPSNVDVQSLLASLKAAPSSVTPSNATPALAQYNASDPAVHGIEQTIQSTTITAPTNEQTGDSQPPAQVVAATDTRPGDDLVSALTRGFSPTTNNPADIIARLAGTPSNQAAANGASLARVPSSQRERKIAAGEPVTEDDVPWTADIQQKYDAFIVEERKYVNDGKWDQFPHGSRLFVGNLSSESVTKRDIFHVFHTYGPLAQISIKQAYGFVQFLNASDCARALDREQGTLIRDRRIHLEISKPQRSRPQRNRSRSPGARGSGRSGQDRNRDSGRGQRSPSPRGRYRDRHDNRRRNRSPTPNDFGRRRATRSPSPRTRDAEDGLPLPRRRPQDIPDVQIVVRETLDRAFIEWVEKALVMRGLRAAVLVLNPRLTEEAVMRRQLLEGVLAIVRVDRQSQNTGTVLLRVYNYSGGIQKVSYLDYDHIDLQTCVELVVRVKGTTAPPHELVTASMPPVQQQYGYTAPPVAAQSYGFPAAYPPQFSMQQPAGQHPQLDINSMQRFLATGGQQQQAVPQAAGTPFGYPVQQSAYGSTQQGPPGPVPNNWMQQPQQHQQAAYRQSAPASGPPQPASASSVNMQDILARLGTYK